MPKGQPRTSTASSSLYKNDSVTGADGKAKLVPPDQTRNFVGDKGAAKVADSRKKLSGNTTTASSSDEQETPAQKKIRQKKAQEDFDQELYGKVKSAMTKKGGATNRSNYED